MNLPYEFISNIQNTFREAGVAFLKALPASIAEASARWRLTGIRPAPTLSYNFVAFARSALQFEAGMPGEAGKSLPVVLKLGVPHPEFNSELATLRLFGGQGACRLLDFDEERCWMLLERLQPGRMLAALQDDEEATRIAAGVMQSIWRPAPPDSVFLRLSDWFNGLQRLRTMFQGGTGPLDEDLVERVEHSVRELLLENHKPVLMHGDFHHFNILSSERGWLVIDPKGVIGPACYEIGPLLMNPWNELVRSRHYVPLTGRRIDILHECLGFERTRIREWGLAHAVLSAWWGIEDRTGWEYSLELARMISHLG